MLNEQSNVAIVQCMLLSILEKFYHKRLNQIKTKDIIFVSERYISSADVFIQALYERKCITEIDRLVLLEILKNFEAHLPKAQAVLFLSRTTSWCMDHLTSRGRPAELQFCTESYINSISKYYNLYLENLSKNNVEIVICEDHDIVQNFMQLKKLIEKM